MKSLGLQDLVLLSSSTAALSSAVVSRGHTTALVLPVLSTGRLARQLHHVSSSAGRAVRMSSSFRTSKAEFKTLVAPLEYEEVIKKSRFIARATPCSSFDKAQEFLRTVSDPKASHNCWAYRGQREERCSDDGEPGGTAGRPMLGAIEAEELKDVMVVITRYFGGIKLGSGGLVRAYAGVTRGCLRAAEIETRFPSVGLQIAAPLTFAGGVYNALGPKAERLGELYEDDKLVLRVRVPLEEVEVLRRAVQDATKGAGIVTEEQEDEET